MLADLADQVDHAKRKAKEERERRTQLAAWQIRDDEREQRRRDEALLGAVTAGVEEFFDPKPSEVPVAAPTVSASFAVSDRNRAASGSVSGKSSANTDHLRTFVARSGACNLGMQEQFLRVREAWSGFTASCSWVPIESASFLSGFERLLRENTADATWIGQIASAFDAAGGSGATLSNHALDLAATVLTPMGDQALLDALAALPANELEAMLRASPGLQVQLQRIDPVIIHNWWQGMNPAAGSAERFSHRQDLLLTSLPVVFGNLEGLPYGARDYANQIALAAAIAAAQAQLDRLAARAGPSPSAYGAVDPVTRSQMELYSTQLAALKNIRNALNHLAGDEPRFLISLTQDEPPLAAVSIGDLDTATSVSYAVPGMDTDTTHMTGWAKAAQNLSSLLPPGSAVVAWIGYQTPRSEKFDVLNLDRAAVGANKLTAALSGLTAVRGETMPQLNIVAHSYGSTTAGLALSQPGSVYVNTFVTLGSAGLPDTVHSAADLNVDTLYSGHARDKVPYVEDHSGDQWAWLGRDNSADHHVNPMDDGFGSHTFGVDSGGDAGRPVTDHGALLSDSGENAGYFDQETESLKNTARAVTGNTTDMTEYVPLDPSFLQNLLAKEPSHVD